MSRSSRDLEQASSGPSRPDLSGVSYDLTAFHTDPIMDEGRHQHTWTITAWRASTPWSDGRSYREALRGIVEALAPETEAFQRELPPELWSGEALARVVLALLKPEPVKVTVDRPGFHVEAWA